MVPEFKSYNTPAGISLVDFPREAGLMWSQGGRDEAVPG
jgi:hypothetical protein